MCWILGRLKGSVMVDYRGCKDIELDWGVKMLIRLSIIISVSFRSKIRGSW